MADIISISVTREDMALITDMGLSPSRLFREKLADVRKDYDYFNNKEREYQKKILFLQNFIKEQAERMERLEKEIKKDV